MSSNYVSGGLAVTEQSDGKIIIVGGRYITRYNANGSISKAEIDQADFAPLN